MKNKIYLLTQCGLLILLIGVFSFMDAIQLNHQEAT